MAYSYSRLEMYDGCPWAYKKVYVDGIKRPTNDALETGRKVHERIAGYLERLIHQKSQTDWQWAESNPLADDDSAAIWRRFY